MAFNLLNFATDYLLLMDIFVMSIIAIFYLKSESKQSPSAKLSAGLFAYILGHTIVRFTTVLDDHGITIIDFMKFAGLILTAVGLLCVMRQLYRVISEKT